MSAEVQPSTAEMALAPAPRGRLLRAEISRLLHRRFIRWLVLLGAVGYLVIVAISFTQYDKPTPGSLATAEKQMSRQIADEQRYYQECLDQVPAGQDPLNYCGANPETNYQLSDFLEKQAFVRQNDLPAGALGIGGLVAGFCFLVGSTWIGAEWSQKTLMALLFWEPRRLRVFFVKLGVLVGATAVLATAAQAVWLGAGTLLASTKGVSAVSGTFWSDLLALQARCVLLAVLLGAIGFGLAHLIRNTGAALGVGFVYFVVELILIAVKPAAQVWALTLNVGALLAKGGISVYIPGETSYLDDSTGSSSSFTEDTYDPGQTIILSNWHGGLVLAGVALVLLVVGGWLFKRRDLT